MKPKARPVAVTQGRHPIAVVATRTGLSPDVLRVWERRYNAVRPTRAPDGQRMYSDADVERLRALRLASEAGRNIGQIARLPGATLARLIEEDAAARAMQPAGFDAARTDALVADALARTRALDAEGLDAVLRRAAALLGIPAFLEQVAVSVLHRIGDEWHAGRLSPAQEHMASSVVRHLIMSTTRDLTHASDAPTVVVATLPGERHEIGAALVGALAAAEGWNVIYLGADLPSTDIAASAIASKARMVALSVVYVENRKRLLGELHALRSRLPAEIALIAGGAGATQLEPQLETLEVTVPSSLADLGALLRTAGRG